MCVDKSKESSFVDYIGMLGAGVVLEKCAFAQICSHIFLKRPFPRFPTIMQLCRIVLSSLLPQPIRLIVMFSINTISVVVDFQFAIIQDL